MRTFRLTSPLMVGARQLQIDCNHRLKVWGVNWAITVDDQYGPTTKHCVETVCYGLGIRNVKIANGVTPEVQALIHRPAGLNKYEHQRYLQRRGWRARLARRYAGPHGAEMAVAYARKMARLNITEHPPGSNRGPYIDTWNRAVGTPPGPYAYWCGAFANACLVAAGFPNESFLAFCPYIEAHARAGIGGWSWHPVSQARPGDLPLYSERGVAGHVEILVANPFVTVGGNTSPDTGSGSQSNGGGVFLRHRNPNSPSFPVRGVARPPYH